MVIKKSEVKTPRNHWRLMGGGMLGAPENLMFDVPLPLQKVVRAQCNNLDLPHISSEMFSIQSQ
jgi:hypothetical protein